MLDPLTAISLASAVVQFTDFGIKLVSGSIELYHSASGLNAERSNLELKIAHLRKFTDEILSSFEHKNEGPPSEDEKELRQLANDSKFTALHLLSVLDDLKVKRPAGPGRKWESFKKAVAAQTPHNKDRIALLESTLHGLQDGILERLHLMMRYAFLK